MPPIFTGRQSMRFHATHSFGRGLWWEATAFGNSSASSRRRCDSTRRSGLTSTEPRRTFTPGGLKLIWISILLGRSPGLTAAGARRHAEAGATVRVRAQDAQIGSTHPASPARRRPRHQSPGGPATIRRDARACGRQGSLTSDSPATIITSRPARRTRGGPLLLATGWSLRTGKRQPNGCASWPRSTAFIARRSQRTWHGRARRGRS